MRARRTTPSPARAVACGLVAGAAGTLALDLVWFARFKRGGGTTGFPDWETSAGLDSWENAPAPALMGKRVGEAVLRREIPPERARLVSNVVHWGYGIAWGAQYGLLVRTRAARPIIPDGPLLGATVWSCGYVVLPLVMLYKPVWEYDARTLAKDLSAHLVYGTVTATAFRVAR